LLKTVLSKAQALISIAFLLLFTTSVSASLFGSNQSKGPTDVEKAFVLNAEMVTDNQVLLRWDILKDYYLYDNRMKFSVPAGVELKEVSRSKTKAKDDPLFGKVDVYYFSSEIVLEIINNTNNDQVNLTIGYQGCWDGGVCYPPVTKERTLTVPIVVKSSTDNVAPATNTKTEQSTQTSVSEETVKAPQSEQDYFSSVLANGDLIWILSAFFVAGLALSLTPCVFPMIPILSSIIAGQGKQITKYKAFILTIIYVLSVSVTYTVAGVLAGLFGENLQVLFQTPWIIALFSFIFVLLALSMFGFYELQLPSVLQSKLTDVSNNQKGGSYIGVAVMGVLSALIVGPCMAAPLAGALIYIGQSADPVLGGMALFSLSIGMGVPLLLVGISAGHFMPRVGAWMNTVKGAFGVLLLLMAIYMLDRIVSIEVTMTLTAITLLTVSVFMGVLEALPNPAAGRLKLVKSIAVMLLIYSLSLMAGVFVGHGNFLQPLRGLAGTKSTEQVEVNKFNKVTSLAQLAPLLAQAKAGKQVAMLDFYADWCISCVELEYMLEERAVASVLKNVMLIKVDLTDYNDDAKALLTKYKVLGPPALVFYDKKGELRAEKNLVGLIAADKFLKHIDPLMR
jgi:thiol:disulfide interchange protein DsbD